MADAHPLSRYIGPIEETLNQKLDYVFPGVIDSQRMPAWPPDVFCLCAIVLQATGAYSVVVDDRQAYLGRSSSADRAVELRRLGERWRRSCMASGQAPKQIQLWWKRLLNCGKPLSRVPKSTACVGALLNLLATADEACRGVGIDIAYEELKEHPRTPDEVFRDD